MNKKVILIVLIMFILIPTSSAWSLFGDDDGVVENTTGVYISNVKTEWSDYGECYFYDVDFYVYKISSNHDIGAIIHFYDKNDKMIEYSSSEDLNESHSNLTLPFEYRTKHNSQLPFFIGGFIKSDDYLEISHMKIDIFDFTDNKILYTTNESFNMSNLKNVGVNSVPVDEKVDKSDSNAEDKDYTFFQKTDLNDDGKISYDELSEVSYIFTEDSFWDGYSVEEIIQSEFDRGDKNGDDYLSFEEFKKII